MSPWATIQSEGVGRERVGHVDGQAEETQRSAGPALPVRNVIAGPVSGQVVQASSIDHVHFHEARGYEQVAPSQLPTWPSRFISREAELEQLRRWHHDDAGQTRLVVLTGPGGIGKTTLALQWLREVGGEFADGQLYLELHNSSRTDPVTPLDALGWFLEALNVPAKQIPSDLTQRAALFRSITSTRRLSVCLDNAVSAAQVRALLPGGEQCLVIATSRSRLSGLAMNGARYLDVPPLDDTAALMMIEKFVGADRVAAERAAACALVALCGGMPLALALVAAPLASRPRRSLRRGVDELTSGRDQLSGMSVPGDASVESVLDPAYVAVEEDAQRLYRACSSHPGRVFGADVAAATVDWDAPRTSAALAALVEANLLVEVADERFAYHDLLLVHARQRAETEDGADVHVERMRRAAEWYLRRTVAADLVIHPLRQRLGPLYRSGSRPQPFTGDEQAALRWLEQERANLRSVVDRSWEQRWDDLAWQMCEAQWGLFLHTRHYGDWITMHAIGIAGAQRCGDRRAEARLRSQLGFAYAKLSRFDEAFVENTRALRIAEGVGDEQARATALSQLGRVARGRGDFHGALDYFRQARDIQHQLGRRRGVALCRRRIGQLLTQLGDWNDAVIELRAAAEMMAELGDRTQHARSLLYLGGAYLESGDIDSAVVTLNGALAVMRKVGSPYYQAEILVQLGEAAERDGQIATASSAYREASDLYAATEDPQAEILLSRVAALAATSSGDCSSRETP